MINRKNKEYGTYNVAVAGIGVFSIGYIIVSLLTSGSDKPNELKIAIDNKTGFIGCTDPKVEKNNVNSIIDFIGGDKIHHIISLSSESVQVTLDGDYVKVISEENPEVIGKIGNGGVLDQKNCSPAEVVQEKTGKVITCSGKPFDNEHNIPVQVSGKIYSISKDKPIFKTSEDNVCIEEDVKIPEQIPSSNQG